MIADDDEAGIRHLADPAPGGLELVGKALLGDVAGDQHQIGFVGVGVFQRGGAGVLVLDAEMDVRELEDAPHQTLSSAAGGLGASAWNALRMNFTFA
jgi:hypothetical protein